MATAVKSKGGILSSAPFLLAFVVSWLAFSSLNELKNANGSGCCSDSTCGKQGVDQIAWWTTLIVGIVSSVVIGLPIIKTTFMTLGRLLA
tara:strand:- start:320 stop:589 length:270 start_codon:yes stop_codon:yes gene_type:complete